MSIAEITRPSVPPPPRSTVWPVFGKSVIGSPAGANEDLQLLHRIGSRLHFGRGETIFNEGDPAEYAYKVVSGAVRLCKHMADGRRQIAQFLLPGDFFSFMELSEHSFTAEAVNDAVLICYPQRQIERLGEERLSLRKGFAALMTKRVRDIQNHLVMLGRQTAKEKIASFLLILIEHEGCKNGALLDVPMSRQDIADYLGLTIETVCRVLSAMKRESLIGIPNLHQLIVKDVDTLYALAEGEE
jgi:CRP/FNR family nitrogen fixation transcriptional regulator